MFEGRLNVLTHQWNNDEDAEHAVDDAGDGSEKIDEKFERVRNSCGSQLCKKNGGADAEGHGDQQSDHAGDFIAFAKTGKKRARAREGAPARNSGGRCCHVTGRYSGPLVPLRRLPWEASRRIGLQCSSDRPPTSTSRIP